MKLKTITVVILSIFVAVFFLSCTTTQYVVRSGFENLRAGMSRQEFVEMINNRPVRDIEGGRPNSTKRFKHGSDTWEVWTFKVYACGSYCYVDHYEYVGLKNDKIEEWGTGDMPITILQNPNQYQIEIKNR